LTMQKFDILCVSGGKWKVRLLNYKNKSLIDGGYVENTRRAFEGADNELQRRTPEWVCSGLRHGVLSLVDFWTDCDEGSFNLVGFPKLRVDVLHKKIACYPFVEPSNSLAVYDGTRSNSRIVVADGKPVMRADWTQIIKMCNKPLFNVYYSTVNEVVLFSMRTVDGFGVYLLKVVTFLDYVFPLRGGKDLILIDGFGVQPPGKQLYDSTIATFICVGMRRIVQGDQYAQGGDTVSVARGTLGGIGASIVDVAARVPFVVTARGKIIPCFVDSKEVIFRMPEENVIVCNYASKTANGIVSYYKIKHRGGEDYNNVYWLCILTYHGYFYVPEARVGSNLGRFVLLMTRLFDALGTDGCYFLAKYFGTKFVGRFDFGNIDKIGNWKLLTGRRFDKRYTRRNKRIVKGSIFTMRSIGMSTDLCLFEPQYADVLGTESVYVKQFFRKVDGVNRPLAEYDPSNCIVTDDAGQWQYEDEIEDIYAEMTSFRPGAYDYSYDSGVRRWMKYLGPVVGEMVDDVTGDFADADQFEILYDYDDDAIYEHIWGWIDRKNRQLLRKISTGEVATYVPTEIENFIFKLLEQTQQSMQSLTFEEFNKL